MPKKVYVAFMLKNQYWPQICHSQPVMSQLYCFLGRINFLLYSLQEFKTSGSSNVDTSKVTGTLETKYKWDEYGLTFTEKWTTENTLGTEICVEDQVNQKLLNYYEPFNETAVN